MLDLCIDLGDTLLYEISGMTTGAVATVGDTEQFRDGAQAQATALCGLDQPDPIRDIVVEDPVAPRRATRGRDQPCPLVVPQGVWSHAQFFAISVIVSAMTQEP
jgi:hypothetical protein